MNFLTMLSSSVTPLRDRVPTNSVLPKDVKVVAEVKKLPKYNLEPVKRKPVFNGTPFPPLQAVQIKSDQTLARYKGVMSSGEWFTTQAINKSRGLHRTSANTTLEKYRALGWVERRLIGKTFNQGYEWRWLDTAK